MVHIEPFGYQIAHHAYVSTSCPGQMCMLYVYLDLAQRFKFLPKTAFNYLSKKKNLLVLVINLKSWLLSYEYCNVILMNKTWLEIKIRQFNTVPLYCKK